MIIVFVFARVQVQLSCRHFWLSRLAYCYLFELLINIARRWSMKVMSARKFYLIYMARMS